MKLRWSRSSRLLKRVAFLVKIWIHESVYHCFFSYLALFMFAVCKLRLVNCWFVCKYSKCAFFRNGNFSLLSISIPNNLTDNSLADTTPFIFNTGLLRSFSELMIIDWNLYRLTIMLFVLNQFIAVLHFYFLQILCSLLRSLQVQLL